MSRPLSILFSGMIASDPWQGGATWAVLQYVLGLRRLGHDVCFVEPIKRSAVRPEGASPRDSENSRYFRLVARQFALDGAAALLLDDGNTTVGLDRSELDHLAKQAEVLINVSGMLTDEKMLGRIPIRVYLDLDPAFVQMWQAVQ